MLAAYEQLRLQGAKDHMVKARAFLPRAKASPDTTEEEYISMHVGIVIDTLEDISTVDEAQRAQLDTDLAGASGSEKFDVIDQFLAGLGTA